MPVQVDSRSISRPEASKGRGLTFMKTGLNTALDPSRRSNDAQEFEAALRRRIVGQDAAIEKVTGIYQMFLAGLNAPGRPVGNLLFLGPTGSGKTRVVEAMAEALFGDARACIKIDCAEFQHTQEALNQWHSDKLQLTLLLFDEIEKASDALWQLLLGILDKATLTLGDNRRVDLSHCIIVMTSNLGAAEMNEMINGAMGFHQPPPFFDAGIDDKITRTAQEAARRKFSPEFMNRIDKVVVFKMLRPEHLEQILEIELGMVQQRILQSTGNNQFVFSCTAKVKDFLMEVGSDAKYGARHLKRAIEQNIVFPLANLVATAQVKLGDFVRIDMNADDRLVFVKEAEGAMVPVLLEKYSQEAGAAAATARAPRGASRREFTAAPLLNHQK